MEVAPSHKRLIWLICKICKYAQYASMHNMQVCTIRKYAQYASMHYATCIVLTILCWLLGSTGFTKYKTSMWQIIPLILLQLPKTQIKNIIKMVLKTQNNAVKTTLWQVTGKERPLPIYWPSTPPPQVITKFDKRQITFKSRKIVIYVKVAEDLKHLCFFL